jgi:hypothetical protein
LKVCPFWCDAVSAKRLGTEVVVPGMILIGPIASTFEIGMRYLERGSCPRKGKA